VIVLANWRGFSGGLGDLFGGVLQLGALIFSALRDYPAPVFVHLPPGAELRGGAWAVLDARSSPDGAAGGIEVTADPTARGGVLEPSGVVEIRFRSRERREMARRLDSELAGLDAATQRRGAGGAVGGAGAGGGNGVAAEAAAAEARWARREAALAPAMERAALALAEAHDGPHRLLARGGARAIVPWSRARSHLCLRLRARLAEAALGAEAAGGAGAAGPDGGGFGLSAPPGAAGAGGGGGALGAVGPGPAARAAAREAARAACAAALRAAAGGAPPPPVPLPEGDGDLDATWTPALDRLEADDSAFLRWAEVEGRRWAREVGARARLDAARAALGAALEGVPDGPARAAALAALAGLEGGAFGVVARV